MHDAFRQLNFIRQALSQNQRPTGFFIGAGCPLSIKVKTTNTNGDVQTAPLIWDVAGLTNIISNELSNKNKDSDWDKFIELCKVDGGDVNNIEYILSRIRQFKLVVGHGEVRGMKAKHLNNLDKQVCEKISILVNKQLPDKYSPYHNLAIWIRSIKRENPVHVFTTNYDLLMEQAFEESSTPFFDGFIGSRKAFFDLAAVEDEKILPSRWARLWKVHGSLNWIQEKDNKVIRKQIAESDESYLIYPSHLKYDQSRKMPYIAMLDRLKDFLLKNHSILFMSGYSFGDEHINDVICRALESNPTAHVFAFLFGDFRDQKYQLGLECALSSPNLSLLGRNGGIVGRNEAAWKEFDDASQTDVLEGFLSKDAKGNTEFLLGDYAIFGNLIRHLTGAREDA